MLQSQKYKQTHKFINNIVQIISSVKFRYCIIDIHQFKKINQIAQKFISLKKFINELKRFIIHLTSIQMRTHTITLDIPDKLLHKVT